MRVRVIATPGHTFTHLSYALEDTATGRVAAVFTGGSLLHGSTGRPDLLGPAHKATLAAAQHASARRLASALADETPVCPTHGFGSFCTATQSGGTQSGGSASTIGQEKLVNPVLTQDEDQLRGGTAGRPGRLSRVLRAHGPGQRGRAGSPPTCRRQPARTPRELAARIAAGEWVVDLRSRREFAAGHVRGSLSFEHGGDFTNYLGWLIPWGTPLTLLGDSPEQVAAAQRDLARIGIDQLAGAATAPRRNGPAASRWHPSPSRVSLTWPLSAATARSPSWTCAAHSNGPAAASTARCTSRCRTCVPVSAKSPGARSGCTAAPDTAP